MSDVILRTTARFLVPLLLLFSLFLLWRGHNAPGGGFAGGLVAAAAVALIAIADGVPAARRVLPAPPVTLIGVGLLVALGSGLLSLLAGQPFLTGRWGALPFGAPGLDLGTPLLFDVGVYVVVVGVAVNIILTLAAAQAGRRA